MAVDPSTIQPPAAPRKRWWLLLLSLCLCVPCCGVCSMSGMRMARVGKERQARAAAMLKQLEAHRADAGRYPEHLTELAGSAEALRYTLCPDGGFELAYTDPSPGLFPSDFEHRFDLATRTWDLKEIGVEPSCR